MRLIPSAFHAIQPAGIYMDTLRSQTGFAADVFSCICLT